MNAVAASAPRSFALSSGSVEALKWVALAAMVLDHANAVFYARELGTWATAVGRMAMPLFAVVLGYNLARPGADLSACLQRLLVFGLLAMPAYVLLFGLIDWWPLNIMATFAVAVGVLLLVERGQGVAAFGLFLFAGALVEYWWPGVALVLASCWFFRRPDWRSACGIGSALCFLCVVNGNAWALLAIPVVLAIAAWSPIVPRCGRFFWWFYPAHLAAIAAASVVVM